MVIITIVILIWLLVLTIWVINKINFIYVQISGQYEISMRAMLLVRRIIKRIKKEFPNFDPEKGELTNGQD